MNKEIEGNNTMGKTRDLFKNRRYQGSISCKAGYSKKTETERTQQKEMILRGGKNTQKNYTKKILIT